MNWPGTCAVVIPCFNEEPSIAELTRMIRNYLPIVLVIDDGSTDATATQAVAAGARVLRHPRNLGKGAALRTGLQAAQSQGYSWAIALDGDRQHAPSDIPAFLSAAERTGADLLVGNRMHQAPAIPWLRRGVNRWMSRQLSRRAGMFLPDSQCGFRLIRLAAWSQLTLRTEHFEIESEMLLAFLKAGSKVEFVPIQVLGRGRRSRIHPLLDTWRWWQWWRNQS